MISQAYIFGALGKAAFQQGDKWFVLDANDPNTVRAWHSFDNNWLSLSDPETVSVPQGKNLDDIRQLLALETSKQEALTLALQLMDESIPEQSLKAEIAELLEEYAQDTTIFHFLENRLLTTIVPDSFDPSFASNICRSLRLKKITGVYELLDTQARYIQIFYTAWLNAAKDYFPDPATADAAFSLLTSEGIAKILVQSIAGGDKHLWDNAALDAALLLKKENLDSNALRFFTTLKTDLTRYFDVRFQEETRRTEQEKEETDEIAELIEEYLENRQEQRKATKKIWKAGAAKKTKARKSADEVLDAVQANVEYSSQKILNSLREGNEASARARLKDLLVRQIQTSASEHICKSLTNIAGFLLSNGVLAFAKILLAYAKALNDNDLVVDMFRAEILKAEGKLAEAKQEYLRIKQQFPDNIVAQTGYAEILKAEGKLAEAKEEYLRIKQQFPNDIVAQTSYAEILKAEGKLAEAKQEYLRIKKQFPDNIVAQTGYFEVLKAEGKLAEAKEEYLRIKKQFPDNIVAQTGYAEILKAEGKLAEAKEEYLRIKKQFPDNIVAQTGYAEILKAEGKLAEAKEEYLRIKQQFPDNIVAQTGYAEILKAEEKLAEAKLAEAKEEYLRIKKQFPDNIVAQTGYAEVLKAEGNLSGAKAMYLSIRVRNLNNYLLAQTG